MMALFASTDIERLVTRFVGAFVAVVLMLAGFANSAAALEANPFTYDLGRDVVARAASPGTATEVGKTAGAIAFGRKTSMGPRLGSERVAPNSTGSRFVVNGAGDVLDSARVTIPDGKFGYLLEDPSKAGVFGSAHPGAMGFAPDSLDTALRTHLVDNFGSATSSVPMVGGGTKFSVTGPMTGPNGNTWSITTAWGVDTNGTIRLITGTP